MTAIWPTVKYHIHATCLPAGWSSLYMYTAELICLDSCRPSQEYHCQAFMAVTTPLSLPQALSSHPDRVFTRYICRGLHDGFRIGLPVHPPGDPPPPPQKFNSVADALHWHLVQSGVSPLFHYLDDYIMVATPDPQLCLKYQPQ